MCINFTDEMLARVAANVYVNSRRLPAYSGVEYVVDQIERLAILAGVERANKLSDLISYLQISEPEN